MNWHSASALKGRRLVGGAYRGRRNMTADPHATPTKPAFQALDVEVPGDGDRGLGPPAPRTPGSPTKIGRTMWTRDEDAHGETGAGGIVGPGAAGGNGGGFNSSPMPPDAAASVITQVTAAPAYGSVARTSAQSFRRPSPVAAAPTKPARRDAGWLGKFFCCTRPPEERSTQLHVSAPALERARARRRARQFLPLPREIQRQTSLLPLRAGDRPWTCTI